MIKIHAANIRRTFMPFADPEFCIGLKKVGQ